MSPVLPRTRTARRPVRTAGLVLALALGLSGCGAGLRAQTYQERTTSDSTNEAIGALAIRHLRILPPDEGETFPAGSDARVAFVIVNEGAEPDRLVRVSTEAARSVQVVGADGRPAQLTVPPQSTVSQYGIVLRGLSEELRTGEFLELSMTFAEGGTEAMLVPVELTGTPGPRREGYEVAHTDSNGDPLPEKEGEKEGESSEEGGEGAAGQGGISEDGGAGSGTEGEEPTGGAGSGGVGANGEAGRGSNSAPAGE